MDTQAEPDELTETPAQEAPFVIDSEDRVCWYLRKLANIEAEKMRVKAQAAAIIARLDSDESGLKYRFDNQVQEWTRRQIEGTRRKSYPTLQGTLSFRSVPARLAVSDAAAALIFAQEAGFALVTTLDAAAYRKEAQRRLHETGETIPGMESVAAAETFSVSFGKAKGEAEPLA